MITLKYLNRYKDLAWLFLKYDRSDLIQQLGIEVPQSTIETQKSADMAKDLAADLEKLGPTYIKLGQFLSAQVDFLPESFQDAFSELQDNVPPFPYEEVERIFFEEFGVKIKDAFIEFNPEPLAGASLSQVHQAVLHSGREVAVKVQRPGIREQIIEDLNMLEELAAFLDRNGLLGKNIYWEDRVKSMRNSLLNELDFRKEARNLKIFRKNLKEFDLIIIPEPIDKYSSQRILTMEYLSSQKITKLHPIVMVDMPVQDLADQLLGAYLKQIFIDGFVHIDPHPGNIYLTSSNQIAMLDVGMVVNFSPQLQSDFLKILLVLIEGRSEELAELIIKLSHPEESFSAYALKQDLSEIIAQQREDNGEISVSKMLLRISNHANRLGLRLPQKINTLGKTLLNLEKILKILNPNFDPFRYISEDLSSLLTKKIRSNFTQNNLSKLVLELTDLAVRSPGKISNFFELITSKEWTPRIQIMDERFMMQGLEKIANRIAFGVVIAALIIGAALLMQVQSSFTILGYPGLAMILFLSVFFSGVIFIFNSLISDQKRRSKKE